MSALFASLLVGCTQQDDSSDSSSVGGTSCGNEYDVMIDVAAHEIDGVAPGTELSIERCNDLCPPDMNYSLDAVSCRVPAAAYAAGVRFVEPAGAGVGTQSSDSGSGGASESGGSSTGEGTDTTGRDSTSADGDSGSGETTATSTGLDTGSGTGSGETATITCTYQEVCLGGRAHAGLCSRGRVAHHDPLAGWLAAAAHDEAASVATFVLLRQELRAHGASAELCERLRRAAVDEARHARTMRRLAREHGAASVRPRHRRLDARSLEAIAIENAVEGCVRETWAAMEAAHQAQHATAGEVREAMEGIASDEARHAALAWEIDAWLRAGLDRDACARVDAARRAAARELVAGVAIDRPARLREGAGLPSGRVAQRLATELSARLWS